MGETTKSIAGELENAKQSLGKNWEILESDVHAKVTSLKEAVSFEENIRKYPVEMVAGAAATGLLIGAFVLNKSKLRRFESEISYLKRVATAVLIEKAASSLSELLPQWKNVLEELSHSSLKKLVPAGVVSQGSTNADRKFGEINKPM